MRLQALVALSVIFAAPDFAQQDAKKTIHLPVPVFAPSNTTTSDPGVASAEKGQCTAADPAAKKACWAMMTASYQYWESSYRHRKESFDWSLTASKIIFTVVLLLVLAGLVFAAIQFWIAFSTVRQAADRESKALQAAAATSGPRDPVPMSVELEISTAGLKVNSSVLGVIILLISMAFFYLYARYVYPIQDVSSSAFEVSQGSSSK